MLKHDYKNLLATKFKVIAIAVVGIGLVIGMTLGAGKNDTPAEVPIAIAPYPVKDFEFTKAEYPGSTIPASIHKHYKREVRCMARNLYFESRDQDLQGRLAVGLVTLNRVNSKNFPNSVCEVVWQKRWSKYRGKWVAQFSWTLDGKSDAPIEDEAYREAVRLSTALCAGGIHDFTNGADHYHATYVNPPWASKLTLVAKIDDHIFYLEPAFKK